MLGKCKDTRVLCQAQKTCESLSLSFVLTVFRYTKIIMTEGCEIYNNLLDIFCVQYKNKIKMLPKKG